MTVWKNEYIPVNKWTRPGTKLKKVVKAVKHYTANPGASARNHLKYFGQTLPVANDLLVKQGKSRQTRSASAHIFIDKVESICIIPLDEVTYAVNDGSYRGIAEIAPNANYYTINVELCIESDGSYHPETIKRAKEVFAELCKIYKLDPMEDIVRHYDITHKNCPALEVANPRIFVNFKEEVANMLKPKEVEKMAEPNRAELPVSDWAKTEWEKAVQNGYFDGTAPQDYLTREQAAAVTNKIVANIRKFVVSPLEKRIEELEKQVKGAE